MRSSIDASDPTSTLLQNRESSRCPERPTQQDLARPPLIQHRTEDLISRRWRNAPLILRIIFATVALLCNRGKCFVCFYASRAQLTRKQLKERPNFVQATAGFVISRLFRTFFFANQASSMQSLRNFTVGFLTFDFFARR